jgi:predicted ATPase
LQRVAADLRAGRGGIVSIVGEAGLGKSRLLAEWRTTLSATQSSRGQVRGEERDVLWIEGRCLSYGSAVAYHLGTDILRSLIGVTADAGEDEVRAALRSSVQTYLGDEAGEVYPFLGHLLGLQLEEDAALRVKYLDGPALQARYVAAYRRLLGATASQKPTVIVADDIQWADPSSVELGLHILSMTSEAPIVFVMLTRPDLDAAGWRLVRDAREIPGMSAIELHLSPLSEGDSQQLVNNLLDVTALPGPLRQLILTKSEGNPFYVEEVIRMLIDRGGLQRQDDAWIVTRDLTEIEIPDTLQGVIMARIDRLPEDAKRTLQIAAVIGRRFQVKVLEEVLRNAMVSV